jgi:hypothetical protein
LSILHRAGVQYKPISMDTYGMRREHRFKTHHLVGLLWITWVLRLLNFTAILHTATCERAVTGPPDATTKCLRYG